MQPCPAADSPGGSSHTRWLAHTTIPDTPPASLHPHYRASSLLPGSPPLCPASVLYLLPFRQLEDLPSKTGRVSRGRSSPMAGRAPRGRPSSSARQPSRPGESHPQPLTEPGVPLSKYPARGIHAAVPGCGQTLQAPPTQGGWPNWLSRTPRPLGSTRITELPSYYEAVRPRALHSVLYLSLVHSLRISHHGRAGNPRPTIPIAGRVPRGSHLRSERQVLTFHTRAQAKLAPPLCRTPSGR